MLQGELADAGPCQWIGWLEGCCGGEECSLNQKREQFNVLCQFQLKFNVCNLVGISMTRLAKWAWIYADQHWRAVSKQIVDKASTQWKGMSYNFENYPKSRTTSNYSDLIIDKWKTWSKVLLTIYRIFPMYVWERATTLTALFAVPHFQPHTWVQFPETRLQGWFWAGARPPPRGKEAT